MAVGEGTRERVLAAAIDEFAAHGLAGGRVERIASNARVNIKTVYLAYPSKERLFDAAVTEVLGAIGRDVPYTPDDLPGWVGRFFDEITHNEQAHRLNLWRKLEAPAAGPADDDLWRSLVDQVRQHRTGPRRIATDDLVVLVPALASAWLNTSRDLAAAVGIPADEARRLRYRDSLVAAVRLLVEA